MNEGEFVDDQMLAEYVANQHAIEFDPEAIDPNDFTNMNEVSSIGTMTSTSSRPLTIK